MFYDIRGLPRDEMDRVVRERLEDVQLWDVADNRVGTFSGGMKRRLSVALSFIGDPKIVFLGSYSPRAPPSRWGSARR